MDLSKTEYDFKTKPFKHQLEHLEQHVKNGDATSAYALFWEQGVGKSKPILDTAAYLYEHGKIDCLLVVAPNGVHFNWITDELKTHLPDKIATKCLSFAYKGQSAKTQWHKQACKAVLDYRHFTVITISYNSFMTDLGKKFVASVLKHKRCLYVLDEADNIKTPKAKRTRSIVRSGKLAPYRRILTGTPITQGSFDIYSQVRFVDPDFWVKNGIGKTFSEFKMYFGEWFTRAEAQEALGYDPGFDKLLRYKNIDKLTELVKKVGHRITKESAGLDLPPKLYSKRHFEMTCEQRRLYDELKEKHVTELESGEEIDGTLAIVRLLRFQQITCGYVVSDIDEPAHLIGNKNPRLDLALETLESLNHQAIIWARFTKDIDQLVDALNGGCVRYDGKVSDDDCERAKAAFKAGDAQFFVSNAQKGGSGLTLTEAKTVMYYSNSFKLKDRLQSEDRAHRIGQDMPVNYIDLVALDSVDDKIISALREKRDVASEIVGDDLKEWI